MCWEERDSGACKRHHPFSVTPLDIGVPGGRELGEGDTVGGVVEGEREREEGGEWVQRDL